MYATAAQTVARLALGTANLKLFVNAGATAPEWAAGAKVVAATFDLTTATGTFDVTGFGFKPSALICIAAVSGGTHISIGMNAGGVSKRLGFTLGSVLSVATELAFYTDGGGTQTFQASAYIADGVTIANTKAAAPTGTLTILLLGLR